MNRWQINKGNKLGAPKRPKRLVKFCTPDDLGYYLGDGSLRFGTLEQYGALENEQTMGARLDESEGRLETSYRNYSGPGNNINLGAMHVENVTNFQMVGCTITNTVNAWVLCMSAGPYSRKLHEQILYAPGCDYPGNPTLTAYVVFDTKKLINAIIAAAHDSPENKSDPNYNMIMVGRVAYNKAVRAGHIPHDNYRASDPDGNDFFEAVFSKPAFFAPENEVRILAGFNAPKHAPSGADPIFLSSPAIGDAIITQGQWDKT